MPSNSISLESSFVPNEPLNLYSEAFFGQVAGTLDSEPKDPAATEASLADWDGLIEKIAADLYRISSMLLGEGEEAVRLIEQVVADLDVSVCSDPLAARHSSRMALAANAVAILRDHDPQSLAAPSGEESASVSCIEDDDLSAAGVTPVELEQMITGPERHRLRDWLEGLSVTLRVVFVLRAIGGLSSPEVAGLLAEFGGPAAQDWTPDAVRSTFRQALCSLASQLIHATATR